MLKGVYIGGFPAAKQGLAAGDFKPEQFKVLTRYAGRWRCEIMHSAHITPLGTERTWWGLVGGRATGGCRACNLARVAAQPAAGQPGCCLVRPPPQQVWHVCAGLHCYRRTVASPASACLLAAQQAKRSTPSSLPRPTV